MDSLQDRFKKEMLKKIQEDLGITNPMGVPRLSKIVVNVGVRNAVAEKKNIDAASVWVAEITGQKPKVTRAKKAIASFKLREGDPIGLVVTLRGKRMYDFFSKLVNVVLPRIRDFSGVKVSGFDGGGNYTIGFRENAVFPEINPGKVENLQGFEVSIATSAKTNEEGKVLLETLGMPFKKGAPSL